MANLDNIMDYTADQMTVKTGSIQYSNSFSGNEVQIKQVGKLVMIKGYFSRSSGTGTSQIRIGTISGVDLPQSNMRFICGAGANAYSVWYGAYGIISTDGYLEINTNTSRNTVDICVTYLAVS